VRTFLRSLLARLKAIVHLARSERATPREIALAVAIGAFVGCSPAIGLHGWLAVGLATLLRKNRLFAFLGSRVSFFLTLPWIVLAEVQIAHRLRVGVWADLSPKTAVADAHLLLLDWVLGWIPVGLALAALTAPLGYAWGKRRARREREAAVLATEEPTERTPPGAPPRSSGSPG
jgi:uncharacterized protein (DUF2062 family)